MNRTAQIGGAQGAEVGEFARADSVPQEAGLLEERDVRGADGLAARVPRPLFRVAEAAVRRPAIDASGVTTNDDNAVAL